MLRVGSALPFQIKLARFRRIQIVFDGESHVACKFLCVLTHDQNMVGFFHQFPGDERRRADTFEAGDGSAHLLRSMHDRGIELNHAFGVRQSAITDTRVIRIKLDNIDARNARVQHIGARRDHIECPGDACDAGSIFRTVSVCG